jgi:hypothetical protein
LTGELVEITGFNSPGIVLNRDEQHIYLWNILIGEIVHSIHRSKIKRVQ